MKGSVCQSEESLKHIQRGRKEFEPTLSECIVL